MQKNVYLIIDNLEYKKLMNSSEVILLCPILPVREMVVFPNMSISLFVERGKSIKALKHAYQGNEMILLLTQKDSKMNDPSVDDLYKIGVYAQILQCVELSDGKYKILIKGVNRAKLLADFNEDDQYLSGTCQILEDNCVQDDEEKLEKLRDLILIDFEEFLKQDKKFGSENLQIVKKISDHSLFVDNITFFLQFSYQKKQEILQETSVYKRLQIIHEYLHDKVEKDDLDATIKNSFKSQVENSQKEYYLNEQIKAIKRQINKLGGSPISENEDVADLEQKIKKLECGKAVSERLHSELRKLSAMNQYSSEAGVVKNYLDWCVNLPWQKSGEVSDDLAKAEEILHENHYGIEKIKDRILEYLAVYQRTKKLNGPILCLHGAPGVGKTSLAKSIAAATGRKFIKISLGGVKDESEIRGHRKTYVGAMPGKIIQAFKKAKVNNPLFLLDEIDKIGNDHRGDPASALLEVLDSEQNSEFQDHYLELDFDLSNVMFVATANTLNFMSPLLDRMEAIHIPSYTEEEKVHIAKKHLIPMQVKEHGLKDNELTIKDNSIKDLIRFYTREAGVRSLNREFAKIARKVVRKILQEKDLHNIDLSCENLKEFSGVKKFTFDLAEKGSQVGMVTGLAYTQYGGTILPIEVVTVPGDGKIKSTGKLGDVMQESVQAAFSHIMSRYQEFGLTKDFHKKIDVHVHVPEGATPKDGPSAGIGICTAILSVLTNKPVLCSVAMTGEITLRGKVFPIGGLKEKLLAAQRSGIKKVVIPKDNERELCEMEELIKELTIFPVSDVKEVFEISFLKNE